MKVRQIILKNQTNIIRMMNALGYRDVSPEGVCFGISCMVMQAILCGQLETFIKRMKKIQDLTEEYPVGMGGDQLIRYLEDEGLPQNEKADIADLKQFFDGVHLYQSAYDMPRLLGEKTPGTQFDIANLMQLLTPKKMPGKISKSLARSCGCYDQNELQQYFKTLHETFSQMRLNKPISIILHSSYHVINVSYDPNQSKEPWIFTDPNQLPPYSIKANNYVSLAEEVAKAFPGALDIKSNGYTSFFGEFYSTDENITNTLQKSLAGNKNWEAIHQVTDKRIHYADATGVDLFYLASYAGEYDIVKKIIETDKTIINGANDKVPLFIAAQNNFGKIVGLLLTNGADPNRNRMFNRQKIKIIPSNAPIEKEQEPWVLYFKLKGDGKVHCYTSGMSRNKLVLMDLGQLKEDTVKSLLSINPNLFADNNEVLLEDSKEINNYITALCKHENGITPLHIAAHNNHDQIITILLMHGADPNIKNYQNQTIADVATEKMKQAMGFNKIAMVTTFPAQRDVNTLYILLSEYESSTIYTTEEEGYRLSTKQANEVREVIKNLQKPTVINTKEDILKIAAICGFPDLNKSDHLEKKYTRILGMLNQTTKTLADEKEKQITAQPIFDVDIPSTSALSTTSTITTTTAATTTTTADTHLATSIPTTAKMSTPPTMPSSTSTPSSISTTAVASTKKSTSITSSLLSFISNTFSEKSSRPTTLIPRKMYLTKNGKIALEFSDEDTAKKFAKHFSDIKLTGIYGEQNTNNKQFHDNPKHLLSCYYANKLKHVFFTTYFNTPNQIAIHFNTPKIRDEFIHLLGISMQPQDNDTKIALGGIFTIYNQSTSGGTNNCSIYFKPGLFLNSDTLKFEAGGVKEEQYISDKEKNTNRM